MIDTAFDAWIPVLVWGGLFVFFLYQEMVLAAAAALMSLLASVMPTPPWALRAEVMLVALSLLLDVIWLVWFPNLLIGIRQNLSRNKTNE